MMFRTATRSPRYNFDFSFFIKIFFIKIFIEKLYMYIIMKIFFKTNLLI
jgi:hypothetical protein